VHIEEPAAATRTAARRKTTMIDQRHKYAPVRFHPTDNLAHVRARHTEPADGKTRPAAHIKRHPLRISIKVDAHIHPNGPRHQNKPAGEFGTRQQQHNLFKRQIPPFSFRKMALYRKQKTKKSKTWWAKTCRHYREIRTKWQMPSGFWLSDRNVVGSEHERRIHDILDGFFGTFAGFGTR
jgi:hypothetical protein